MRQLIDYPRIREAPEDVLVRLRSIDPTAELLYWGPRLTDVETSDGKTLTLVMPVWLLGTMKANAVRRDTGKQMVETHEGLGAQGCRDAWRYGRLLCQNFAPVTFYPTTDPNGAIVADFQKRDWIYRHRFNEALMEALYNSDDERGLEMRVSTILEKNKADGPSIWRFTCAKRRSVTSRAKLN